MYRDVGFIAGAILQIFNLSQVNQVNKNLNIKEMLSKHILAVAVVSDKNPQFDKAQLTNF